MSRADDSKQSSNFRENQSIRQTLVAFCPQLVVGYRWYDVDATTTVDTSGSRWWLSRWIYDCLEI